VHELATAPDAKVALPEAPEPEPEPEDTVADEAAADAPGSEPAPAREPAPRPVRARQRTGPSGDIVIYLLAAAVLALSIAGLVLLLSSG